ncbi:MAG: hypothetical protein Q8S84_08490 [bacterium]|nr:hypothetical protein [bacterium]MDP3381472.1 hypothetical protein [bacterium]
MDLPEPVGHVTSINHFDLLHIISICSHNHNSSSVGILFGILLRATEYHSVSI